MAVTLASIIGNRIYFADPSQQASYPCVVVTVPKRSYGYNLDGHDGTSLATVDITALAATKAVAVQIAEIIRNNFQGFRGLQSGVPILRCFLDDESDDAVQAEDGTEDWVYECTLTYLVMHRVPMPNAITQTNV